jgi:hypothetical protein
VLEEDKNFSENSGKLQFVEGKNWFSAPKKIGNPTSLFSLLVIRFPKMYST